MAGSEKDTEELRAGLEHVEEMKEKVLHDEKGDSDESAKTEDSDESQS